jgi:drug/metabolite transporter (DMT)-like permease
MNSPSTDHRTGIALAGFGVLVLSFDALLVRLADTGPANVAFWRGLLVCVSLVLFMTVRNRLNEWRSYWSFGLLGILVTVLYGINSTLFVISISYTKVSNTVVILSSSAFFAALFSWLILRETLALRTWLAIAASVGGVLIVFSGSFGLSSWLGDLIALILSIQMGLTLTLLRKLPDLPKVPMVALSGIVTMLLALPFAQPLAMSATGLGALALMGLVQMPVASVLLMKATRYLPSPEVSLFLLIETVLGPIWVWLVLSEQVTGHTLLGGAIVLGAIFIHSWLSLRIVRTGR